MKWQYKLIIGLFVLLLITPIITAQPSFLTQSSTSSTGLNIIYPKLYSFVLNENFTLYFHVTNSSGFLIKDADCKFHLYNTTNLEHLHEDYLNFSDEDYFFETGYSTFKKVGVYPYNIFCNNSMESGYLSSEIIISRDGSLSPEDLTPYSALILAPVLFGIICIIGSFLFREQNWQIGIMLFILGFFSFILSLLFGLSVLSEFYYYDYFVNMLALSAYSYGVLLAFIVLYFAFIFIWEMFIQMKKEHIDKKRGVDYQKDRPY